MAKIKPLRQSPLFQNFTDREIAIFSQAVDEITLAGNETVLKQPLGLIMIKTGTVHADYLNYSTDLGPGEFFGELSLLSADSQNGLPLRIQASESCEILRVLPTRFEELAQKEPEVAFRVVQAVGLSLRKRILAQENLLRHMVEKGGE